MKLLLILLLTVVSFAQTLSVSVSPLTVPAGGTATIGVSFTDCSPSCNIAGLQGTILSSALIPSVNSWVLGNSSVASQKIVSIKGPTFIAIGSGGGTANWSLNNTSFGSGVVFYGLAITAPNTSGTVQVSLTNLVAVTNNGAPITITSPIPATLTVACSIYAITGDCSPSITDVQEMFQAVFNSNLCVGNLSIIGDNKCTAVDVMLEILAAQGKIQ